MEFNSFPVSTAVDFFRGLESSALNGITPGSTIDTALDIGNLDREFSFRDSVSPAEPLDVFSFSLRGTGTLAIDLQSLSADADLYLVRDFNGDRLVNNNEIVAASERAGNASESIRINNLVPGQYFVFVSQYQGSTSYELKISADVWQSSTINSFSPLYGFGLVDARAAVGMALGQSLEAVPDRSSDVPSNFGDLNLIDVPAVWERGITGKGVVVAVLDTGVDINHPDLKDNIWVNLGEIAGNGIDDDGNGFVDDRHGWDFGDRDNSPTPGRERGAEHGTHVAGTIGAKLNGITTDNRGNRVEVQGVAPDATIMPVRVLGGRFGNTADALARGIRYAVDNGADIINLSLGAGMNSPVLRSALTYAEERGVIIVAAAGNDANRGATVPSFPARDAALVDVGIAVGAVDRDVNIASFSNPAGTVLGEFPFVVAPGVRVLSTLPGNRYGTLSGTSMATPHVAGLVALLLQANPNLTPSQVENILIATSRNPALLA
ncbi:MAG: peptidase S8 [Cyanobacteria bacterium M5B4]|nr:MAG: peptidase S8 [Cyanobacteria bacterium M5B4]